MLAGMVISQIILEWWEPADEILVDVLGDVAEVVLAAYALPAFNGLSDWIRQPRLLQRFMVWPMILGPALTAFPVAAVFARELHIGFWSYWARWFTGDMLGIVLWLPLGLILLSSETYELFKWRGAASNTRHDWIAHPRGLVDLRSSASPGGPSSCFQSSSLSPSSWASAAP